MKKGTNDTYIRVYDFMLSGLGLSGNEALIFALIYSYCQSGDFMVLSKNKIAVRLGLSLRTVNRVIRNLVERGLVEADASGDAPSVTFGVEILRLSEKYKCIKEKDDLWSFGKSGSVKITRNQYRELVDMLGYKAASGAINALDAMIRTDPDFGKRNNCHFILILELARAAFE